MSEPTAQNAFEKARSDAVAMVEAAIAFLRTQRGDRLATAQIDPVRLNAIAEAASAVGFSKLTADFPVPLFQTIVLVDAPLTPYTLRLNEAERGAYTIPQMADPVSNETSWWRETLKSRVASVVLSDVIRTAASDEIAVLGPENYWQQLRDRALQIGQSGAQPILIVQSEFRPRWLYDWRMARVAGTNPKPDDLQISRRAGGAPSYLFHMNDIAVYHARAREKISYLMPSTLLNRLQFTRYGNGFPVEIQWIEKPNDTEHGTITATFSREVSTGEGRILKIRYG